MTHDRQLLDTRGLFCPEPIMLLHKKIRDVSIGEALTVWATDPATMRDITKFCRFLGHELKSAEQVEDEFHFVIIKTEEEED